MRFSSKQIPTIEVAYHNHQFIYYRSDNKIINPWIDIKEALKQCFHQEPIKVGCFFNRKKHVQEWKSKLKPISPVLYSVASDDYIIKRSLEVIFAASFEDPAIIRLCIALTKSDWYQAIEHQHQKRKNYEDRGYLSRLKTSQQVAKRLYKIFQMQYVDVYCEGIEEAFDKKKQINAKTLSSPLPIYPIVF